MSGGCQCFKSEAQAFVWEAGTSRQRIEAICKLNFWEGTRGVEAEELELLSVSSVSLAAHSDIYLFSFTFQGKIATSQSPVRYTLPGRNLEFCAGILATPHEWYGEPRYLIPGWSVRRFGPGRLILMLSMGQSHGNSLPTSHRSVALPQHMQGLTTTTPYNPFERRII